MPKKCTVNSSAKSVRVRVNSALLNKAHDRNIDLCAPLAQANIIRGKARTDWLADNQEAIGVYNALVESQGVHSDGLRDF